jgi:hypothetical protein
MSLLAFLEVVPEFLVKALNMRKAGISTFLAFLARIKGHKS